MAIRYKFMNWGEYQHYKDRCPPWIKLHHSLITSEVWVMGNDASRTLAIACMLLASRDMANDGSFNGDPEYVKRFAYLNSKPDFEHLINHGFIELVQDASNMLAECNTEKRREEKRIYIPQKTRVNRADVFPEIQNRQIVDDWLAIRKLKKLAVTETALEGFENEVTKSGFTVEQALIKCCHEGWGGFKAKWIAEGKTNEPKKAWE